ncbi:MAG: hypothetical protein D6683_08980 [Actinomyces sp.]|nr:MAG: hypothetical protein D6683_08980 [Actinomyces sp.]
MPDGHASRSRGRDGIGDRQRGSTDERTRGVDTRRARLDVIGWREWVTLTDWGVARIKAKIDTGARTSALHAFRLEEYRVDGRPWVRFEIHPHQRSKADALVVTAPVREYRRVKSSNGLVQQRPVVRTSLTVAGHTFPVDLTLTNRDEMGFRMLIGRAALRRRFLIDPAASFLGGH